MTRFYALLPEGEFSEFQSLGDAIDAAQRVIDEGGKNGWDDGIESVEYGMLVPFAQVEQIDLRDTPNGEFDYTCDYRLAETENQRLSSRLEELHARQMLGAMAFAQVLSWALARIELEDADNDRSGSMTSMVTSVEQRFWSRKLIRQARASLALLKGGS
jgi:hypothetical protein